MKTDYTVIYPDGQSVDHAVDMPEEPGYDALRALIKPLLADQEFEHVTVWHDGKYTDMFVDEMGALVPLPVNLRASAVYRANVMAHQRPTPVEAELPFIYGVAVLFHRKVWF